MKEMENMLEILKKHRVGLTAGWTAREKAIELESVAVKQFQAIQSEPWLEKQWPELPQTGPLQASWCTRHWGSQSIAI